MLQATEKELDKIIIGTSRSLRPLVGAEKIRVRVRKVIDRYQVAKHFDIEITDNSFFYERSNQKIQAEANLEGIYVIRTPASASVLYERETVKAYKSLSLVEPAFRPTHGGFTWNFKNTRGKFRLRNPLSSSILLK
ncbi:hypothetical protein NDA07_23010 [Microcoleus vaginatus DQ-U2]|uniref:hypothetical protein n=1 Tax=Microcoleus vaginatus TaxID=119532 RepID=UPI0016828323|nr:hypothetical protein [Microcoleus sp. FACHB-DQ6]